MSTQPHCTHLTPREDLWLYRHRTIALLRKYFQMAIDLGRLPSLLGREFFRTRVTSYTRASFEDCVVFVHDVERCFDALERSSQLLIARIVLQDYTQAEAAVFLGCSRRTVIRKFPEAIDDLTALLLDRGILLSLPKHQTCQ